MLSGKIDWNGREVALKFGMLQWSELEARDPEGRPFMAILEEFDAGNVRAGKILDLVEIGAGLPRGDAATMIDDLGLVVVVEALTDAMAASFPEVEGAPGKSESKAGRKKSA